TLMRKITRQLEASTSQPPRVGPITKEIPLQAVHCPIAAPRAAPENVAVSMASEAGVRRAPATPWMPRKTISVVAFGAAAHRIEATAKNATPIPKTRSSPKMSPSEPPTRMSDPSVSRYASTTHCCEASPPPRSCSIAFSATLTTDPSTNAIDEPRMLATSVQRPSELGREAALSIRRSYGGRSGRPPTATPNALGGGRGRLDAERHGEVLRRAV